MTSTTAPTTARVRSGTASGADIGAVVIAASDGANWAWNELVHRFGAMIGGIARSHRLNPADAAEVSQITWMRLVENIDRIRQPDRVGAWIATTARRECLRVLRNASRTEPLAEDDLADVDDSVFLAPEERSLTEERDFALRLAYARLPARCQVLLFHLVTGETTMSYKTLSDTMDMRIGSIGPTRARCLAHLRRLASEYGLELIESTSGE